MEEEKVLKSTAEKALMSLAHEILRKRNRMSLSEIHDKAAAIMNIAESKQKRSKRLLKNRKRNLPLKMFCNNPLLKLLLKPYV